MTATWTAHTQSRPCALVLACGSSRFWAAMCQHSRCSAGYVGWGTWVQCLSGAPGCNAYLGHLGAMPIWGTWVQCLSAGAVQDMLAGAPGCNAYLQVQHRRGSPALGGRCNGIACSHVGRQQTRSCGCSSRCSVLHVAMQCAKC